MSEFVFLGLGSNRDFNGMASVKILREALKRVSIFVTDIKESSVYVTKAMYVTNQNDFYNMVICGQTNLDAQSLLIEIHKVEASLGRNRDKEIRFGPRTIDIDIELFGNQIIQYPDLEIPHIRMYERAFVLVPFIELYESINNKTASFISKFEPIYKKALESVKSIDCQGVERI